MKSVFTFSLDSSKYRTYEAKHVKADNGDRSLIFLEILCEAIVALNIVESDDCAKL